MLNNVFEGAPTFVHLPCTSSFQRHEPGARPVNEVAQLEDWDEEPVKIHGVRNCEVVQGPLGACVVCLSLGSSIYSLKLL